MTDKQNTVGNYFHQQMQSLLDLKIVGDVRGSHFMVGVELVTDKNSKTSFEVSDNISMRIFKAPRR